MMYLRRTCQIVAINEKKENCTLCALYNIIYIYKKIVVKCINQAQKQKNAFLFTNYCEYNNIILKNN
jgi:hypothetical protein